MPIPSPLYPKDNVVRQVQCFFSTSVYGTEGDHETTSGKVRDADTIGAHYSPGSRKSLTGRSLGSSSVECHKGCCLLALLLNVIAGNFKFTVTVNISERYKMTIGCV